MKFPKITRDAIVAIAGVLVASFGLVSHFRAAPRAGRQRTARAIEIEWRIKGLSGRVLMCAIYRTDAPGLEVRVGYDEDDVIWSQRVTDIEAGRRMAEKWRQAVLAKGGFEDADA